METTIKSLYILVGLVYGVGILFIYPTMFYLSFMSNSASFEKWDLYNIWYIIDYQAYYPFIELFYSLLDIGLTLSIARIILGELERKHSATVKIKFLFLSPQSPIPKLDLLFVIAWIFNGILIVVLLFASISSSYQQFSSKANGLTMADVFSEFSFTLSVAEALFSCYAMLVLKKIMSIIQHSVTSKRDSRVVVRARGGAAASSRKAAGSLKLHDVVGENSTQSRRLSDLMELRDLQSGISESNGMGEEIIDYSRNAQNFDFYSQAGLESLAGEQEAAKNARASIGPMVRLLFTRKIDL